MSAILLNNETWVLVPLPARRDGEICLVPVGHLTFWAAVKKYQMPTLDMVYGAVLGIGYPFGKAPCAVYSAAVSALLLAEQVQDSEPQPETWAQDAVLKLQQLPGVGWLV
jgi:hypothetical protein